MLAASQRSSFHLTVAGPHENVTVSAAPALVDTQPSARLHAARPTRPQRFPPQRPPLLRPRPVLSRRHARSAQPRLLHQRRSLLRRHSRIPEQLPHRRRRLQQRLLRAAARTRSRPLRNLHRSGAGVPRFHHRLRRRTGPLRRRRRQRRHQVRLQSPAWHGFLLFPRQFSAAQPIPSWRSSRTTASSNSEAPSAAHSSATKFSSSPDSISTSSTIPTSSNFVNGSAQVIPQPGTGPYTPGDYEAYRPSPGLRRRRATHFARRRISRRANRQHLLRQARHQSHAAQPTRA